MGSFRATSTQSPPRLIRDLHDASLGWAPPDDAVWGGNQRAGEKPELVSHRDYRPGNVVFRAGMPVALIDFDLACPTTRLYDIANAMYWWAPLLHPLDRAPALADADIPRRVAIFADAYGMSAQLRQELVPFADEMIRLFHSSFHAAAQTDPVFRRRWDEGVKDRLPRAEAWIVQAGTGIRARASSRPARAGPGRAQRDA